jgi:TonB family protein
MLAVVCAVPAAAQSAADAGPLVPIWLPRATYPQIALSARLQGEVEIAVQVRPDGSVASASIGRTKGPVSAPQAMPLLEAPALEAARESYFMSRPEAAGLAPYTLTYAFVLDGDADLAASRRPQIGQHSGRLTTEAKTGPMVCILWGDYVVRGPKCLYLWRCGRESAALRAYSVPRARDYRCLWLWNCGWDVPEPATTSDRIGS